MDGSENVMETSCGWLLGSGIVATTFVIASAGIPAVIVTVFEYAPIPASFTLATR